MLSFFGGLHGRTLAALSCTHTKTWFKMDFTAFDWPVAPFPQIKYPLQKYREYNKEEEAKCLEKVGNNYNLVTCMSQFHENYCNKCIQKCSVVIILFYA